MAWVVVVSQRRVWLPSKKAAICSTELVPKHACGKDEEEEGREDDKAVDVSFCNQEAAYNRDGQSL